MRTLVTDDFAERPDPHSAMAEAMRAVVSRGNSTTSTNVGANIIVTTGGYVEGDPPAPEPYRTQAWVEKPKEIES